MRISQILYCNKEPAKRNRAHLKQDSRSAPFNNDIEGFPAALDIKADGVDGTVGAEESRSDRRLVTDISFRRPGLASAWDADPTRSGWRDAARTWHLWLSRCRTIRRPRNPVPPKTVMSPRWPAVLCVGSSAMAVSRHAHRYDLSRASPTRRSGCTSACSGVPPCQRASRRMNVELRADNRPDAEPSVAQVSSLNVGWSRRVPRNRKGQSRRA